MKGQIRKPRSRSGDPLSFRKMRIEDFGGPPLAVKAYTTRATQTTVRIAVTKSAPERSGRRVAHRASNQSAAALRATQEEYSQRSCCAVLIVIMWPLTV